MDLLMGAGKARMDDRIHKLLLRLGSDTLHVAHLCTSRCLQAVSVHDLGLRAHACGPSFIQGLGFGVPPRACRPVVMTSAGAADAMLVSAGAAKTVSAGFWVSVRPLPIVRSRYALNPAIAGLLAISALPVTCAQGRHRTFRV